MHLKSGPPSPPPCAPCSLSSKRGLERVLSSRLVCSIEQEGENLLGLVVWRHACLCGWELRESRARARASMGSTHTCKHEVGRRVPLPSKHSSHAATPVCPHIHTRVCALQHSTNQQHSVSAALGSCSSASSRPPQQVRWDPRS